MSANEEPARPDTGTTTVSSPSPPPKAFSSPTNADTKTSVQPPKMLARAMSLAHFDSQKQQPPQPQPQPQPRQQQQTDMPPADNKRGGRGFPPSPSRGRGRAQPLVPPPRPSRARPTNEIYAANVDVSPPSPDAAEGRPKSLSPRAEGERRLAPLRNSRGTVLTSSATCSLLEAHSTSPPSSSSASSTSPSFPLSSSSSSSSSPSSLSHSSAPLVSPRSTPPIPIVPRISLPANLASSSYSSSSSSSTSMSSSPPTSSSVTSNWSNPRIKHRTASVASFHEAGIPSPSLPMQSPRLMALNSHRSPSISLSSRPASLAGSNSKPVSQERVRAAIMRALQSPEAKKIALTLIQNEINKRIVAPKDLSSLLIPNPQENLSLSPFHLVQAFQERLAVDSRSWVPSPDLSEKQKDNSNINNNDDDNDNALRIEPPSPELLLLRQILCDHRVQQTSLFDAEGIVFGWPETIDLFELELVPEHDESSDPILSNHPDRPLSTFLIDVSSFLDAPQLSLFLRKVNFFFQHHHEQHHQHHQQNTSDDDLIDLSEVTDSSSSFVELPLPSLMYVCRSATADAKRIAIAQSIHIVHYD